jgi:hypothetical protein
MTQEELELDAYIYEMLETSSANLLVFVETTRYDKVFWTDVLQKYLPAITPYFIANSHKENRNFDGNKGILKIFSKIDTTLFVNKPIVCCLDSDYANFINHLFFLNNPLLLQTHSYAIENHNSIPTTLNYVAKRSFETSYFDFNIFLSTFSEIIFELFCYLIHFEKRDYEQQIKKPFEFNHSEIASKISLKNKKIDLENHGSNELQKLKDELVPFINAMKQKYIVDISETKKDILRQINPNETFLYFHGHILIDEIIIPIFEQFIKNVMKAQLSKIRNTYEGLEISNEGKRFANHYQSQLDNFKNLYKETWLFGFENKLMNKIESDIISSQRLQKLV